MIDCGSITLQRDPWDGDRLHARTQCTSEASVRAANSGRESDCCSTAWIAGADRAMQRTARPCAREEGLGEPPCWAGGMAASGSCMHPCSLFFVLECILGNRICRQVANGALGDSASAASDASMWSRGLPRGQRRAIVHSKCHSNHL